MSRVPETVNMVVVRGATWADSFLYLDANGDGIDLTDYDARMQVRSRDGRYGDSTTESLLLELTTGNGLLVIDIPDGQTVPCRVNIVAPPADVLSLNPDNLRKNDCFYGLEVYDSTQSPEYVIPIAVGRVRALGETTR